MRRFKTVRESGVTFLFKFDSVDPTILHIYARHLTTIDDALDVYFDSVPTWNNEFRRFENRTATHGIYWIWQNETKKVVLIIELLQAVTMTKRRNYEELPDTELPEEEAARIDAMIEQADRELEEARVSFRWGREQLDLVKRAADAMGVPYQTFIKVAVFERATDVLKSVESLGKPEDAA